MKRFFPSTIMLTPFLVKPYPEQEEYAVKSDPISSPSNSNSERNHNNQDHDSDRFKEQD